MLGVENPWTDLYNATRVKRLAQAPSFIAENLTFRRTSRDRLFAGRRGRIGAFRTAMAAYPRFGKILRCIATTGQQQRSPSAPTWCNVRFNSAEKSWDCPCHGSRFDVDGRVLNGPALTDLAAVSDEGETVEERQRPTQVSQR